MKRIVLSLILIVTGFALKAQVPISQLPVTTNPSGYIPLARNGYTYKVLTDSIAAWKLDSLKVSNDTLYSYSRGVRTFVGVIVGGSGSSIDTTSLSNRINLKLNISDTADMLTDYVRAKRLSDTASAIRSAFPKFGTSTDNIAAESREFNANNNLFSIKNAPITSGIFTGNGYADSMSASIQFDYPNESNFIPAPFMRVKYDNANVENAYIGIQPGDGYLGELVSKIGASQSGKTSEIYVSGDYGDGSTAGIYLKPSLGKVYIDTIESASPSHASDSIVVWNNVTGKLRALSQSAFATSSGSVPSSRTLTINGTTYDLSEDRSWIISTGDFYAADGTFSGNRRANLDGYRLTFDSGQVRYRDTMTSSTGKLYGMISDYGRAGVEHINYDSLTTAYHSVNTVTGVKFGVKDQNNLDTNNYIQADASGAYAVTVAVSTSDSSNKIATTKWVKQQLYGSGGSSDGNNYLTSVTYEQDIRTMNFSRSGLADLTVQLPIANSSDPGLMSAEDKRRLDSNSYLLNPVHPDSLLFQLNDSVMQVKSVTVESQLPDITINTVRTDTTIRHQLVKLNISEPIISFTAGAGFAADTTVFTDSTLYGSFYTGQDSFYVTKAFAVLKGQSGDTLGIQVVYNDTFNVTGTVVGGGTLAVTNRTTGNSFDISTNSGIPPNMWVWLKSPTVVSGKKPEYLSVTLIGYRKYIAP